jgi:hypothetical protein
MLNIVISAVTVYAVILLLVFLFQARLVYFPEVARALVATPRAVGLDFEEVRLAADGETLHGWWVPANAARGAVLIFHGNAGNISHRLDYLTMFNRLGYATLIIDYRGYGKSTGTPSEDGTYRDGEAAWRHLIEARQLKPQDIVLFGESLGGGVATWLALEVGARACRSTEQNSQRPEATVKARDEPAVSGDTPAPASRSDLPASRQALLRCPRALVLASTFTSAPDLGAQVYPWLPVRWLARIEYNNLERIPRIAAPVLIAHSKGDDIIPFSHGQALFDAAREPKQFLELRGGHNDGFIFMREEWVREVGAFLERAEQRTQSPSTAR